MKSLQKTITFRVLATISTFLIGWGLTGNYALGASIGIAQGTANTALYYVHEKMWEENPKQAIRLFKKKEDLKRKQ